jgi:hypothetical protein
MLEIDRIMESDFAAYVIGARGCRKVHDGHGRSNVDDADPYVLRWKSTRVQV